MSDNISLAGTLLMSKDGDDNLQDFQYNGTDFLYNLEPQQLNFFMPVAFFDPYDAATGKGSESSSYSSHSISMPENLEYRINKVSGFKLPGLTIDDGDFDKGFRVNYAGRPTKQNTLTISWLEDSYQTVRRYHMNWLNHWYNKYLDCMVCGRQGKYRNFSMYLFHYVNINNGTGAPIFRAKPIACFTFMGLMPESIPDMTFDYSNGNNTSPVDITYKINGCQAFFYPYEKDDKAYIGGMAAEIQEGLDISSVKNTGITGTTTWGAISSGAFGKVSDANHEKVYYI